MSSEEPQRVNTELGEYQVMNVSLNDELHRMNSELRVYQESVAAYEMNVNNEFQEYRSRVMDEFNQAIVEMAQAMISEQHAELLIAAQEDEGATYRIEELEHRCQLGEHQVEHIHQMEMRLRGEDSASATIEKLKEAA